MQYPVKALLVNNRLAQHALAKTQQSGFGGLLSFELKGGQEAGWRLIDATQLHSITAN